MEELRGRARGLKAEDSRRTQEKMRNDARRARRGGGKK